MRPDQPEPARPPEFDPGQQQAFMAGLHSAGLQCFEVCATLDTFGWRPSHTYEGAAWFEGETNGRRVVLQVEGERVYLHARRETMKEMIVEWLDAAEAMMTQFLHGVAWCRQAIERGVIPGGASPFGPAG